MKWAWVIVCSFLLVGPLLLPGQTTTSRPPPMVHIKAWFIEVPQSFFADAAQAHHYIPAGVTNGTGVVTQPDKEVFLHEVELQKGVQEIAEPEFTTISGRQVQMRATVTQTITTNHPYGEAAVASTSPVESNKTFSDGSVAVVPEVVQVETGPVLEVAPIVLPGDYKIYLQAIPSLIGFLDSADAQKLPSHYVGNGIGQKIKLPTAIPEFQIRQAPSYATLYDGQTMVLFPKPELVQKAEKQNENKFIIVLVTATLIDPAGNRFHSDDEMPFALNSVPPQLPIAKNTDYIDPIP